MSDDNKVNRRDFIATTTAAAGAARALGAAVSASAQWRGGVWTGAKRRDDVALQRRTRERIICTARSSWRGGVWTGAKRREDVALQRRTRERIINTARVGSAKPG